MLSNVFTLRFLVVDREFSGKISTRKLIIETAKSNVISAYSAAEAIESVRRFPVLDGIVLNAGLRDRPADEVVRETQNLQPKLPIVMICAPGTDEWPEAEYHNELFDPARLLELLQSLRPQETAAIWERNQELSKEEEKLASARKTSSMERFSTFEQPYFLKLGATSA